MHSDRVAFKNSMEKELEQGSYELVLTTNFWPEVSSVCNQKNIKYVSWFFDSPPNLVTTECMEYPCNKIYFFTRGDYQKYKDMGFDNVYYLPLAVNTERLKKVKTDYSKYGADVSFVGKLYEEYLPILMSGMDDYQKGYLDGIIKTQIQLYGEYIVEAVITEEFAASVRKTYKSISENAVMPSRMQLCWQVAAYITHLERVSLLSILSKKCDVKLYTYTFGENLKKLLPQVKYCGSVNYLAEMPQVFRATKVNLCPILKANKTGIPLRALDIMGCGGFLLSAYQPEIMEYFIDGRECVMYTSIEDAVDKTLFYLEHDDLRSRISAAGMEKIERDFRFEDRIKVLIG